MDQNGFKPKNREWVKDAAIVFLAVLLVLTFFSNTIMNRSLAEVATAQVVGGPIVAKVRGSGVVTANGSHEVKMEQTKEIRSVMVKVGQEVNAGDTLFILGAGDSDELESAKETLRELQYSYQRAAIGMPNFDYTSQQRAINNAEIALAEAEEKLDAAAKNVPEDTKEYLAQLQSAKAAWDAAELELKAAEADFDSRLADAQAQVDYWQAEVNRLSGSSSGGTDSGAGGSDQGTGGTGGTDQGTGGTSGTDQGTGGTDTGGGTSVSGSNQGGLVIGGDGEGGSDAGQTQSDGSDTSQTDGAEPTAIRFIGGSGGVAKLGRYRSLGSLLLTSTSESADLIKARQELANAQTALSLMSKSSDPLVSAKTTLRDSRKGEYEALYALTYTEAYEAYKLAEREYQQAEMNLNDAYNALYNAQVSNEKTMSLSSLELQQISEKIKLQQEKINELSGETEDQITANVSGIIQTINCTAGNTVAADTVICTIEVPDMGHSLSFSVTKEQAQRLRVGDTATISNYYWGNEVVATLSSIQTDPKNPQTSRILKFELEGDVTTGAEMSISVGQKSANYDILVPNSAIRSDTNGSFVLAVQAKNSPLGNRYIAKRVSVEVLASDDTNSAVVAELSNGDYVITTSNSPVASGDQVRMADES